MVSIKIIGSKQNNDGEVIELKKEIENLKKQIDKINKSNKDNIKWQ